MPNKMPNAVIEQAVKNNLSADKFLLYCQNIFTILYCSLTDFMLSKAKQYLN